jgi:haloalkane dehalogenase
VAPIELHRTAPVAYREAVAEDGGAADTAAVVCVHGFPESSLMWEPLLARLAERGQRALAPDLYALGDSDGFGPATFEHSLERFSAWVEGLELERVALVVHDWGGFIGLAWACDHPDRVAALVISNTGFFADGKWHGMAQAMRSDQGEEIVAGLDRAGFAALLQADGTPFDDAALGAYWAPFAEERGQRATLEFYRSMDFEKLARYEGKLAQIGCPVLLLWGAEDQFAPIAGAHRFQREIPGARLVAIDGAGHFVFDAERERCVAEVSDFLAAVR